MWIRTRFLSFFVQYTIPTFVSESRYVVTNPSGTERFTMRQKAVQFYWSLVTVI
jgi:hypothetical protein